MKKVYKYLVNICILVSAAEANATDISPLGSTARSLAMGGTYMSFVKGADSVYYNPAMLARVNGFDFVLAQVNGAYSKDAERLISQAMKSGSSLSASDINGLYGLNSFADITIRSSFVMPYFGLGVYSSNYILESFNNPPFPTFNANFISDYGYVVAGAIALGPTTSFGFAGRHVVRWGGSSDILVTDLLGSNDQAVLQNSFKDKGIGEAMDLGFVTTIPNGDLSPTISATWQDVGRTTFSQTAGSSSPPSQADNLTLGVSLEQNAFLIHWTHALEYKYITRPNENITKKIHVGTEASFGLFDIRGGFGQGYLSYGGGIDIWLFRADVAYYTAELGSMAGQMRNDRVIYSLTFEFDFDQSFQMKDTEGKKRRLKQRR
ncbi:MAG: hypothetical protein WA160_10055 [Pseudobdellovibrio sp.]